MSESPNITYIFAATASAPLFDRGFTGHEHVADFGLINKKFALSESRAKFYLGYAERCKLGEANGLWGITKTRFGINYGCVSYAARALWTAGVPTIPIINYLGPSVLWTQLAIRQLGIQASPFLIDSFSFGNTQHP